MLCSTSSQTACSVLQVAKRHALFYKHQMLRIRIRAFKCHTREINLYDPCDDVWNRRNQHMCLIHTRCFESNIAATVDVGHRATAELWLKHKHTISRGSVGAPGDTTCSPNASCFSTSHDPAPGHRLPCRLQSYIALSYTAMWLPSRVSWWRGPSGSTLRRIMG